MKLFKLEHDEKGVWYFTNTNKAAKFLGTSKSNVDLALHGFVKKCKGWTVKEIEDDFIISKFINPEKEMDVEQEFRNEIDKVIESLRYINRK